MHTALSSYALIGIEAVPADVVVDGDQARVVETETGRTLRSFRLETTGSVASVIERIVNARTSPGGNLAPADLKKDSGGFDCPGL